MSVRTMKSEKHDVRTDPKWYPVTRGLNRWVNHLAERNDLIVRVPKRAPAAAVFIPENGSIDIRESTIARIDPTMGVIDLLAKFPEEMGAAIHETAHAAHSTMSLPAIARKYGDRHTSVFLLLEEGRCESQQWYRLDKAEQAALSMMVPRFVLTNMSDDEDEKADMSDVRTLVRLVGLLAARRHKGIVLDSQVKVAKVWATLVATLPNIEQFEALAIRFAQIELGWYSSKEDTLHEIVREWMALEDALPKPEPKDEDDESESGEGEGEPGESESESGEGETESGEGESQPAEGDAEGEGPPAKGEDESEQPTQPDDGVIGDDDEGDVGEGDQVDSGGEGSGALGDYNSIDPDTIADVLSEIIDDLREAAPEAQKIHGSRLGIEVQASHKANARDHEQRRRDNKAAARKWRTR